MALNDTLKDELPRLYDLTAKLAETCLKNFVQIQSTWWNLVQKKIEPHVETFPDDLQKIISDWSNDYSFAEAQVLSLGICNGSSAADTVNLLNFNAPGSGLNTPSRPSNSSARPESFMDESSPRFRMITVSQARSSSPLKWTAVSRPGAVIGPILPCLVGLLPIVKTCAGVKCCSRSPIIPLFQAPPRAPERLLDRPSLSPVCQC